MSAWYWVEIPRFGSESTYIGQREMIISYHIEVIISYDIETIISIQNEMIISFQIEMIISFQFEMIISFCTLLEDNPITC